MKLYGYWRSSAAYRVRIAMNLKNVASEHISVHLVKEGGEQHKADYVAINPQQLVPSLLLEDGTVLTQSMAMLEYLEEKYPEVPLLPTKLIERVQVRAMANLVACDVHPLNNLRVLQYLEQACAQDEAARRVWYQHWVQLGFSALEAVLEQRAGEYCFGDAPSLADVCLIPQVYNAVRFNVPLVDYPNIVRITDNCNQLQAFIDAIPENQSDAVV